MSDEVLVDTSVWIDYFNVKRSPAFQEVSRLLRERRVFYTGIVALELIRGARTDKELLILDTLFRSIECIEAQTGTHQEAGRLGYRLARKGFSIGTVDLLLSQLAIERDLWLYSQDQHFQMVAKHTPLKLYRTP